MYVKSEGNGNTVKLYAHGLSDFPYYDQRATVTETSGVQYNTTSAYQRYTFTFTATTAGYVYPRLEKLDDTGSNAIVTCFQLESGSQATPYFPMGTTTYHIPVKITSATQTFYKTADDKLFTDSTGALYQLAGDSEYTIINIPIEAPLGANEVISRAETGIEIPTYNGQNVLSVETEVQPEKVKIWFKESI